MGLDELVRYCLAKPGAEETYPWGDGELVAKVGGKAFAFIGLEAAQVGLKAGEVAGEWCDRYPDVITPSAYLARHGWITVPLGRGVPDDEICELLDTSYAEIVAKLPKKRRPVGA